MAGGAACSSKGITFDMLVDPVSLSKNALSNIDWTFFPQKITMLSDLSWKC